MSIFLNVLRRSEKKNSYPTYFMRLIEVSFPKQTKLYMKPKIQILKFIPKSKEPKITMAILKKKEKEDGFTEQQNIIRVQKCIYT